MLSVNKVVKDMKALASLYFIILCQVIQINSRQKALWLAVLEGSQCSTELSVTREM